MTVIFVTLCCVLLAGILLYNYRLSGRLALVAPSTIFLAGLTARYGVGSLIIRLTPKDWVLPGEFSQYIVSWENVDKTSGMWIVYLLCFALGFCIISKITPQRVKGRSDYREKSVFALYMDSPLKSVSQKIVSLTLVMLALSLLEAVVGMGTGSSDRGSGYVYWTTQPFKPISAFIAFARLRQLAFLVIPFAILKAKRRCLRALIVTLSISVLAVGMFAGGRGTILYPLIMMWIGWILCGAEKKRIAAVTFALVMALVVSVPVLATYQDSEAIRTTSPTDVIGRAKGMFGEIDGARLRYRFQALGREVYACSDAFLFLERNEYLRNAGYSDLTPALITKLIVPRILSKNKKFEKGDGSEIAKKSIGVVNPTWFPCITTPADLWRRGSYMSVALGGMVVGIVIQLIQKVWLWVGARGRGLGVFLIILFPASYVHYGLYGTLREFIWQIAWDMPKYLVIIVVMSLIVDRLDLRGGLRSDS